MIVLFHEGQEVPDGIRQALGVKSQGETVMQGKAFVVAPSGCCCSGRVAEGFASKEQAQDFVKRLHTLITQYGGLLPEDYYALEVDQESVLVPNGKADRDYSFSEIKGKIRFTQFPGRAFSDYVRDVQQLESLHGYFSLNREEFIEKLLVDELVRHIQTERDKGREYLDIAIAKSHQEVLGRILK